MIDTLLFRASSMPKLMGAKGLGVTGEKEAIKTYINAKYDRFEPITSKYLEKGNEGEQTAIDMFNRLQGVFLEKNTDRKQNDFFTGECDLWNYQLVTDIKCSWSLQTFFESKFYGDKDYEYQLRTYMNLWEVENSAVAYCLIDMPDMMLLSELERKSYKYGGDLPDHIAIRIVVNSMYDRDNFHRFLELAPIDLNRVRKQIDKFVHIPESERLAIFYFREDEKKLNEMQNRVKTARQFLKTQFT
jgi:hypothetical protein